MAESKVYILTAKGSKELSRSSTALSAAELKLLVLIDGMASVDEIAKRSEHQLEPAAVAEMIDKLAKSGYVADPDSTAAINVGDFFKEAGAGLASLQANGFFVRIARRVPERAKLAEGQKITVLVVEDDPQLAKVLRTYLQMEGFTVRVAATREEINKALREPPLPDVVLLDVVLPDADGFEILDKLRQHQATKAIPVIMATAKATREAVLNGLRRDVNGYVTKPYDMPVLVRAVYTVLGLSKRADGTLPGRT